MKPAPMPWILCGPLCPPLSTGDDLGSTAIILTLGFCSLRYFPVPEMVPPVPTPPTKISTLPSVSLQISGPVIFLLENRLLYTIFFRLYLLRIYLYTQYVFKLQLLRLVTGHERFCGNCFQQCQQPLSLSVFLEQQVLHDQFQRERIDLFLERSAGRRQLLFDQSVRVCAGSAHAQLRSLGVQQ